MEHVNSKYELLISDFGLQENSDDVIHQVTLQVQRRRDVKLERLELGLAKARSAIMEAIKNKDKRPPLSDKDYVPMGPIYRNAYAFHRYIVLQLKLNCSYYRINT